MSHEKRNHSGGPSVFITGLSGFIGSAVAEHLHSVGFKVSGLIRKSTRRSDALDRLKGKVTIFEGDLTDFSGLKQILRTAVPDYILHFGAISPVSYSFDHPQEVLNSNFLGSVNLAEAARAELPNFRGFLYASSMEVYGVQEREPFTEDITVHPNCPYAVYKFAMEKYLEYLGRVYKFPCVSTRQTNCYGRKDNDYFVIEAIITKMLKNKHVVNLGRKEPVRNFIHINDVCAYYEEMIQTFESGVNPDFYGMVFNMGPTNGLTIEELAKKIAKKLKWRGQINWDTHEIRSGEIFYLNSDGTLALSALSWCPTIGLDEGLDMTIDYWKKKLKAKK